MSIRLYMDVHVRRSITTALRLRGVEVITAQEDSATMLSDAELLDRASELDCILFSQDHDLLAEATVRQRRGQHFAGVIYAHQLRVSIGTCVEDLELLAKACEPGDLAERVEFLPLR